MIELAQMTMAELAAHLAEVTAELQRRSMTPEQKRRAQTAERTRRWRERQTQAVTQCDAGGDAAVTHSTEQSASRGDALVTQAVTLKEERFQTSKEETEEKEKPLRGKKKEMAEPSAELAFPAALDTPLFRAEFRRWMDVRRGLGKKPKDWQTMFAEQLRWLAPFGVATATAILAQSIRNGWQGLFELKAPVNCHHNGHSHGHGLNVAQPRAPNPRAGIDAADFMRWLKAKYPRATVDHHTATIEIIQEYRQQLTCTAP